MRLSLATQGTAAKTTNKDYIFDDNLRLVMAAKNMSEIYLAILNFVAQDFKGGRPLISEMMANKQITKT